MSYIIMSGIDVGKKRYEAGSKVTKQDLGKSFKWLNEQGIVIDEKDLERARNDKGHFVADDPDTPENEAWVKKEEEE
jgi:hypothetical protein